jgi:integrase
MMIQRRALAAGIATKISAHSFRATGITTYLQNGGKLEVAQQMAGHESARTTGLYDRPYRLRRREKNAPGGSRSFSMGLIVATSFFEPGERPRPASYL